MNIGLENRLLPSSRREKPSNVKIHQDAEDEYEAKLARSTKTSLAVKVFCIKREILSCFSSNRHIVMIWPLSVSQLP